MSNQSCDFMERCYKFSENCVIFLEKLFKNSFFKPIITQAVRSATSIGANVHESKHSKTKKEFCRYYEIALKSGNESSYWFRLLKNTLCRNDQEKIEPLYNELLQLNRILAASVKTMRKNLNS